MTAEMRAMRATMRNCPNKTNHQDGPAGYDAWHEWRDEMARTHHPAPCPDCGRFVIWVPRAAS